MRWQRGLGPRSTRGPHTSALRREIFSFCKQRPSGSWGPGVPSGPRDDALLGCHPRCRRHRTGHTGRAVRSVGRAAASAGPLGADRRPLRLGLQVQARCWMFHAPPPGASLTVRGAGPTTSYPARFRPATRRHDKVKRGPKACVSSWAIPTDPSAAGGGGQRVQRAQRGCSPRGCAGPRGHSPGGRHLLFLESRQDGHLAFPSPQAHDAGLRCRHGAKAPPSVQLPPGTARVGAVCLFFSDEASKGCSLSKTASSARPPRCALTQQLLRVVTGASSLLTPRPIPPATTCRLCPCARRLRVFAFGASPRRRDPAVWSPLSDSLRHAQGP